MSGEVFSGLLPGVTLINGQDYFLSGVFPDADADETDQLVRVFVDFRNNEKTKNYQLSIPNGDYWVPSYARITKAAGGRGALGFGAGGMDASGEGFAGAASGIPASEESGAAMACAMRRASFSYSSCTAPPEKEMAAR